jgi:hypothetical protein
MEPRVRRRHEQRVLGVLAGPLRRAQAGGCVRGDLVPSDLALLFGMIEGVADDSAAARRSIDLALDGLFRASINVT